MSRFTHELDPIEKLYIKLKKEFPILEMLGDEFYEDFYDGVTEIEKKITRER